MIGNYDPRPEEREYYTHQTTGDRGYRVVRDGKEMIRYDRGDSHEVVVPFNIASWERDELALQFSDLQIAEACFKADQIVSRAIGKVGQSMKDWRNLTERERNQWMYVGPKHPRRRRLWISIREAMRADPD